jgi:hypothetical protein
MKTHLAAKIQRQNSKQKRFEKRADELIRDGERVRERKRALSQRLTRRNTTNTDHQKGPRP